ncbi:MAG: DUF3750 domain-containing protein [Bacteroidota bacterium]|nr:DUF3750 domain-containing protein [Kiloniellaceae bacterium]
MAILAISLRRLLVLLGVLLAGPALALMTDEVSLDRSWSTASRDSAGLVPPAATTPEAVVQVYAARAFDWRGAFAVHTWIAVKPENAPDYTTYEIIGWRYWRSGNGLTRREGQPDRHWFGAAPHILAELRGAEAAAAIPEIEAAVAGYPFARQYRTWPGPNSNTFTAWVGRQVPALRLDLPPTAVGKDYLGMTTFLSAAPSGTGYQISVLGALGLLAAREEGVEVNLLGLTFGLDPLGPAFKMPGLGRLGAG